MHLPTREIITNCLFDLDENSSQENLNELLKNDSYARIVYESEIANIAIEAYLSDELPKEEKQKIDDKLSREPKFKVEVKLRKYVNQVIVYENLRNQMESIHNSLNKAQHPEVISLKGEIEKDERNFKKWMLAASIALLIGLTGGMLSQRNNIPIENRLYAQYYEPFNVDGDNIFLVNSTGLDEARKKYKEGDFQNAYIVFKSLPENIKVETEKNFYQGLTLMEMNSFDRAIEMFNLVLENKNAELLPQAYWYMGLCYLQIRQKEKAKEVFGYIATNHIYNYQKAEVIINKLK